MLVTKSWVHGQLKTALLISTLSFLCLLPAIPITLANGSSSGQCNGHNSWTEHLSNFTPDTGPSRVHRFSHDLHLPCPTEAPVSTGTMRLQNVSVCPWTNALHYDFDRFPYAMTYVRCSCGRCSNSVNGNRRRCVPLYHTFHVMRRVCEGGNYRYVMAYDRLPVACVCIHIAWRSGT